MSNTPLHVAFIWHMHQPYYKDPATGLYRMPWVRLHGIKDYLDMVAILNSFESICQTFNLVPCLLEQIIDYAHHGGLDRELELTMIPALRLSPSEKLDILLKFFSARRKTMIDPFPRYRELLEKRGPKERLTERLNHFTTQDFLDLQVWFNLAWIDPFFRKKRKLARLVEKGEKFTEREKKTVFEEHLSILRSIIPTYRLLFEKGQIEVATSPYFHPILPLLCDTQVATESLPSVKLPMSKFSHPEDAAAQIGESVAFFRRTFGRDPRGIWPPEGSVSQAIVPIVVGNDFHWLATDEDILAHSLGQAMQRDAERKLLDPSLLYKPYVFKFKERNLYLIFRDRELSHRIDFVYRSWDPQEAADDLFERLLTIRDRLLKTSDVEGHLVSIILDGENCWERYPDDGHEFLHALYERISNSLEVKAVTVSQHLERYPPRDTLRSLFPGSWINHNFGVWIGHPEENRAWDLLQMARDKLVAWGQSHHDEEILKLAWRSIYIAEGSDWFWWFGDDFETPFIDEFDELFRDHLSNVYRLISQDVPPALLQPIASSN